MPSKYYLSPLLILPMSLGSNSAGHWQTLLRTGLQAGCRRWARSHPKFRKQGKCPGGYSSKSASNLRCEFGMVEARERPGTEGVKMPGPEEAERWVSGRSEDGPRVATAGEAWRAGVRARTLRCHGGIRAREHRTAAALCGEGLSGSE